MATSLKTDGADAALQGLLGLFASLSTATAADATEADADESVAGRQPVAWTYAAGTDPAVRKASNTARVRFAFTSAQTGAVKSVQIWTAATGGDLRVAIDLDAEITGIGSGSRIDFDAGDLVVDVRNAA